MSDYEWVDMIYECNSESMLNNAGSLNHMRGRNRNNKEEDSEEPLGMVEDGSVDFSEIFPLKDKKRIIRQLSKRYSDIIDAINSRCNEFDLNFR